MEIWLWCLCIGLGMITLYLTLKVYILKKSAKEIRAAFAHRLVTDTNTLIDITSRDKCMKQLAIAINEQLKLLREQQRRYNQGDIEMKEGIVNLSHDIRTPLTAICGYLELLEREEQTETTTKYLGLIQNRTQVLKQLTEELFRYSVVISLEEGKRETLVLNHVLEESLASYYGAMKQKNIVPKVFISDIQVKRYLNRSELVRIFGNIIDNVLKYSDGDFKVSMDAEGKICFINSASNLNPVIVGRLFDRFYTVETGRSSTGLGLSIAKILVERMEGKIESDYKEGKLYITLRFET